MFDSARRFAATLCSGILVIALVCLGVGMPKMAHAQDEAAPAEAPAAPAEAAPAAPAAAAGLYSAVFQVGKGYFYDTDSCTGTNPGLKIECVDGAIELIEGGVDTSCNVTSENEIVCTEDENSLINENVDVAVYVSVGGNISGSLR